MSINPLPANPSLVQLKGNAKTLRDLVRAGATGAIVDTEHYSTPRGMGRTRRPPPRGRYSHHPHLLGDMRGRPGKFPLRATLWPITWP